MVQLLIRTESATASPTETIIPTTNSHPSSHSNSHSHSPQNDLSKPPPSQHLLSSSTPRTSTSTQSSESTATLQESPSLLPTTEPIRTSYSRRRPTRHTTLLSHRTFRSTADEECQRHHTTSTSRTHSLNGTAAIAMDRSLHLRQLFQSKNYRWEIRPLKFARLSFMGYCKASMILNLLWPFVPAGIILSFVRPDLHLWVFIINYIAMAPAANLLGYSGQELAQKLPHVVGTLAETTFGAMVEMIMFTVLLVKGRDSSIQVIRHAILGSILANLLLCLGLCFFIGGIKRKEQRFHSAVSEAGTGLMLVAGTGLVIPAIYSLGIKSSSTLPTISTESLNKMVLQVSRASAVILLLAYLIWVFFQIRSHHGMFDDLLRQDHLRDPDLKTRYDDELTMTEALVAIIFSIAAVSFIAISLAEQIHFLVIDRHLSDSFVGLILVPIVEKAASHLSAVDEAWDNQMNMALSHVLGGSVQTALLNTPFIVFLAWTMGVPMSLNFEPFEIAAMLLTILVVGNFLRDGKSNYLEGALCVCVYLLIAICAYEMPNPVGISDH